MSTETLFTVADVARIFALNESRVRYWAQTGFINPCGTEGGRRLYTFSDLVSIKAAKELLDRGIPLQRVRKNLQALRAAAPDLSQLLPQLRVCSDGETLVVAQEQRAFDPLSGQLVLDFEISDLRQQVAQVLSLNRPDASRPSAAPQGAIHAPPRASAPTAIQGEPQTAYGWFLRGCACDADEDEDATAQALEAYQRAVELDPSLAPAFTNMGNLHYRLGNREEALRNYQLACTLDPDQPEARYNLANLYEELGDLDMAIATHRRALASAPDFADAHFNLAQALEQVGSTVQALHHWRRFVELTEPNGAEEQAWLELAAQHVAQLATVDRQSEKR